MGSAPRAPPAATLRATPVARGMRVVWSMIMRGPRKMGAVYIFRAPRRAARHCLAEKYMLSPFSSRVAHRQRGVGAGGELVMVVGGQGGAAGAPALRALPDPGAGAGDEVPEHVAGPVERRAAAEHGPAAGGG